MRRHAVLLGLVLASCGFPVEDESTAVESEDRGVVATAASPTAEELFAITVWFVADDRLVAVERQVANPSEPSQVAGALAVGVSVDEAEAGLRSAIPDPSMLLAASAARGTVTVALSPGFAEIAVGDQALALAQVVFSMTELRGVGRVRFEVDGEAVAVPLPDGTSTEDAVSRDDFDLLAD